MNFRKLIFWILSLCLICFTAVQQGYAQQTNFADLEYPYPVMHQALGNGQTVAYVDEGKGAPVILIHGLGSYIPAWKRTIPALTSNHRVIALDLPGYGKSSKEVDEYSIPFFAETVAQLQDSLGIDEAVWIGHSMGGQIAIEGALRHRQKISRLVLISTAGFEQFTQQEGAMMRQFVTPASIETMPDAAIRRTFKLTFYDFPDEAQFMADDRVVIRDAEDFDGYARAYAGSVQAMLNGAVFEELSEITQPALIIFGKQDALIPNRQLHPGLTTRKVAETGHEKIPNSHFKMVDKAGHFVHFEKAGIVNEAILNFINN